MSTSLCEKALLNLKHSIKVQNLIKLKCKMYICRIKCLQMYLYFSFLNCKSVNSAFDLTKKIGCYSCNRDLNIYNP